MNQHQEPSVCKEPQQSQLLMPLYKVILINDDHNDMLFVVGCLVRIFHLADTQAFEIMITAHTKGSAICAMEMLEVAELRRDQLRSCGLTSTIEPA